MGNGPFCDCFRQLSAGGCIGLGLCNGLLKRGWTGRLVHAALKPNPSAPVHVRGSFDEIRAAIVRIAEDDGFLATSGLPGKTLNGHGRLEVRHWSRSRPIDYRRGAVPFGQTRRRRGRQSSRWSIAVGARPDERGTQGRTHNFDTQWEPWRNRTDREGKENGRHDEQKISYVRKQGLSSLHRTRPGLRFTLNHWRPARAGRLGVIPKACDVERGSASVRGTEFSTEF